MAIAADPSGAVFGIWQAGQMIGSSLVNEPGGLTWEDLRSTDPAAAQDFYRALFGYRLDPVEMAGPDYGTFALPGEQAPLGGMGPMMGSPEGTPSTGWSTSAWAAPTPRWTPPGPAAARC